MNQEGKAEDIEKSLKSDEVNQENSTLQERFLSFQQALIHKIKPEEFSDMYAHTNPEIGKQIADKLGLTSPVKKNRRHISNPDEPERIQEAKDREGEVVVG